MRGIFTPRTKTCSRGPGPGAPSTGGAPSEQIIDNLWLPGNFSVRQLITVCEGLKQQNMQDEEPALVLHSEAATQPTINDTQSDFAEDGPQTSPSDEHPRSDEELMVAFSRGHTDAFSALFARYKQPVFGFFRRRVADPAQAEELTQETFLAILRASERYQPSALFRKYLYAVGFKILRAYRSKTAFRATFLGKQTPDHEPAIEDAIEARTLMRDAVGKLDSLDREILLLREFEQLSYAEIADLLSLPLNTVRSRLFRARQALHDLLAAPATGFATHALAQAKVRL